MFVLRMLVILLLCTQSIYSMELTAEQMARKFKLPRANSYIKIDFTLKRDDVLMSPNCEKAFKVLLWDAWCRFGHDDFRNLAMTNKSIRKLVIDSAQTRKDDFGKYIKEVREKYKTILFTVWNTYGTVCNVGGTTELGTKLFLHRYTLHNNKRIKSDAAEWSNFLHSLSIGSPLIDSPFMVNGIGSIKLYGCGKERNYLSSLTSEFVRQEYSQHIFEYTLTSSGMPIKRKCFISLGTKVDYEMMLLINFPVLLASFLKSRATKEEKSLKEIIKVFYLDGTKLPNTFKQCHNMGSKFASFDALPTCIKNPIMMQYLHNK